MDAEEPTYDLRALCEAAGVTPRTVRFYVQQGLLPSPGLGAGARYTAEHLQRLELIRRLQRTHLPLAEIRRHLDEEPAPRPAVAQTAVREPEVMAWMRTPEDAALPRPSRDEAAGGASGRSAAEYIRDLLRERHAAIGYPPPRPEPGAPRRSQWDRIELTADIELHVRRPLTRDGNRRLERLLQAAGEIFEEEP